MTIPIGSTAPEMESHYSLSNAFYASWLDPTMSYSCAMFNEPAEPLETAQRRKLEFHLDCAGICGGARLLDVGCGWGGAMFRAVETGRAASAVGITVSGAQCEYIQSHGHEHVRALQTHWLDYQPAQPFDGIISIGAFEHFARVGASPAAKIAGYREFLQRCHGWLRPGAYFSLQTIAYGNMDPRQPSRFLNQEIFPASELPTLAEIAEAVRGLFEVVSLRNDRLDYAETNRRWLSNLRREQRRASAEVGAEVVEKYLKYLRLSVISFHLGNVDLLRIRLRRIDTPRTGNQGGSTEPVAAAASY
jgi:cyclopropane-fatty-acyl-phospholipid synthase